MEKISMFKKLITSVVVMCLSTLFAFSNGENTELFLTGTTNTPAGDYVVQTTKDLFHYQGKEYEVFRVSYDDPVMDMKIAVNTQGKCTSFIAYNGEFMFFYDCNNYGFGVRKVMFSNPWVKDAFDVKKFKQQTILLKDKKIRKKDAVGLIAAYVPQLKV